MVRIGIVTIFDNNNYGNRLQTYALQEMLKTCGFQTVTFRNYYNKKSSKFLNYIKRSNLFWNLRTIFFKSEGKQYFQRKLNFNKYYIDQSNLNEVTGTHLYFAHLYTPSERGSNEHLNGLLREFIPKGRAIGDFSDEHIKWALLS